jgi:arsenate reductase
MQAGKSGKKTGGYKMIKVLFVCIHNGARSQIAEAYLNKFAGDRFFAESAGIEPGVLNPLVVKSMKQEGIDISGNKTKSVFDFYKQGRIFDYVITVCDKEAAERCPLFIGVTQRLNWSFSDPSKLTGTEEEKLKKIAEIRDAIKSQIMGWIGTIK